MLNQVYDLFRLLTGQPVALQYGFYLVKGLSVISPPTDEPDEKILLVQPDLYLGGFDNNIVTLFIHIIGTGKARPDIALHVLHFG